MCLISCPAIFVDVWQRTLCGVCRTFSREMPPHTCPTAFPVPNQPIHLEAAMSLETNVGLTQITFLPKAKVYHCDFSLSSWKSERYFLLLFISITCLWLIPERVHKYGECIFQIKSWDSKLGNFISLIYKKACSVRTRWYPAFQVDSRRPLTYSHCCRFSRRHCTAQAATRWSWSTASRIVLYVNKCLLSV